MIEIRDCGIDVTEGDVDVGDGDEKKEVVREGGGGGVVGEAEHGGVVDREVVITVVVVTVAFKDEIEQEENNYGDDVCPKVLWFETLHCSAWTCHDERRRREWNVFWWFVVWCKI